MTRDELEALVWLHAVALCGPPDGACQAMDTVLSAIDAYARAEARRVFDEYALRRAAGMQAADDPAITAERRRLLMEALPPDPRIARRRILAAAEAAHGAPEDEVA